MNEGYVVKNGKCQVSDKKLSALMYAFVICRVRDINTFGIGIYKFTRRQNSGHSFDFEMLIKPEKIQMFEEVSGIKLTDPIQIQLNQIM